jgi:hypothetical protein
MIANEVGLGAFAVGMMLLTLSVEDANTVIRIESIPPDKVKNE